MPMRVGTGRDQRATKRKVMFVQQEAFFLFGEGVVVDRQQGFFFLHDEAWQLAHINTEGLQAVTGRLGVCEAEGMAELM